MAARTEHTVEKKACMHFSYALSYFLAGWWWSEGEPNDLYAGDAFP